MTANDKNFNLLLKRVATLVLHLMTILVVLVMIGGSGHAVWLVISQLFNQDPILGLVNVEELLAIFSVLLNILIGYELFKSISIIIKSDVIPVAEIVMVAGIAVANKIITLDSSKTDPLKMLALGALIVALGISYYFYTRHVMVAESTAEPSVEE